MPFSDFLDDYLDSSSNHGSIVAGLFGAAGKSIKRGITKKTSWERELDRDDRAEQKLFEAGCRAQQSLQDDVSVSFCPTPVPMILCKACKKVDYNSSNRTIRSPTQLLVNSQCEMCSFYAKFLQYECPADIPWLQKCTVPLSLNTIHPQLKVPGESGFKSWPEQKWQIWLAARQKRVEGDLFDDLTRHEPLSSHEAKFRILSEVEARHGAVDHDIILSWVLDCENNHRCSRRRDTQAADMQLIDVRTREVVAAPRNARYIILSYVWGDVRRERHEGLPPVCDQTIEDAITMTSKLGERYLWVDRYCIAQDDKSKQMDQINRMDQIFSGAILTIVAVSSPSSKSGLPGVSRLPGERQFFAARSSEGLAANMIPPEPEEILSNSAWVTRGWTLQEELLSRRLLFLADSHYWLQCHTRKYSSIYTDSHYHTRQRRQQRSNESSDDKDWSLLFTSPGRADRSTTRLEDCLAIVEHYTTRRLTVETDIVNAFAGITTRLQAAGFGNMRGGLPLQNLAESLCWHTLSCQRRIGLPSWSWTGWQGPVTWTDIMLQCSDSGNQEAYYGELFFEDLPKHEQDRVPVQNPKGLDFAKGAIRQQLTVLNISDVLHVQSPVARLKFVRSADGTCQILHKGKIFVHKSYGNKKWRECEQINATYPRRNWRPFTKRDYGETVLQPGCFYLSDEDAAQCSLSSVGSSEEIVALEAEFMLILSIKALWSLRANRWKDPGSYYKPKRYGTYEYGMVWAMMIVREEAILAQRAALVRMPTGVWGEGGPREDEVVLT